MLSQNFWEMFKERYGCDITIQLRRYESFEKMLPPTIVTGHCYSSFEVQLENWYDPSIEGFRDQEEKK